jgi:hypothetical protein
MLAQRVKADVVGGGVQQLRVVLELTETAVAVEAEQSSHLVRGVIVVDVSCGRGLADGTQTVLHREHDVRFFGGYAVPTAQMVGPFATNEILGASPPRVVAGLAIRSPPRLGGGVLSEGSQGQNLATVGTPLVSFRDLDVTGMTPTRRPASPVPARLMALARMLATVEGVAITGVAILRECRDRTVLTTVPTEL